ncbi:M15 family metallopeptidase [Bacillus infantis]|uniref:M15 family metallopeptidase n=1 Tax=Bacillus infantis TaxID=324767 RepID=UPI0020050465|nr:M15 family metallopeptidase [Bacillus infantis]MCK6203919.1 M15 family metallopeptidase [Bacillus infantis]
MDLATLKSKAEKKLVGVHPVIREKALELVSRAFSEGIYVIITQGLRTIEEQNALYAQGRTKPGPKVTNARGGTSYHNFGLAFDFAILEASGNINWNVDKRWKRVGAIGESMGLEWGGRWTSFVDIPHFQLTFGLSCTDLRNGKKPPAVKQEKKEEIKLYKPTSKALTDLTKSVLEDLTDEKKHGKDALNASWKAKFEKGELTDSDAIGLVFVAIDRGLLKK